MKVNFLILLSLMFNINFAQKKQCNLSYNLIENVFNSESIESMDTQLTKNGYTFSFNTTYTSYWNEKQKINFSIYWDNKKSKINFINVQINNLCYNNLKQQIINLGFKKVYEKMLDSRIDLYYKKNDNYIILGKVNRHNLTDDITENGFDVSMITEEKYYEFIKK